MSSGKIRATLRGHTAPVTALNFSPDGRSLASGGWDGKIIVWDLETAKPRETFVFKSATSQEYLWPLLFTPDGSALIAGDLDSPFSRAIEGKPRPSPTVLKT